MASPPKFVENSIAPLSSEELADDQAASSQTTDPLDKPGSDSSTAGNVDSALINLPPG